MPGETKENISGWTTDTVKWYLEARITELEKLCASLRTDDQRALEAALQAVKEENEKVALAFEKRFDSVNEFRKTLADQTNTFIPRLEYAAQHKSLEDKVALLTDRMNQGKGVEDNTKKIYAAIGAVGVILGIIVLLANNVL